MVTEYQPVHNKVVKPTLPDFYSGNGEKTTRSMHEYIYWLQLRAAELDSDGTYSPEMFK